MHLSRCAEQCFGAGVVPAHSVKVLSQCYICLHNRFLVETTGWSALLKPESYSQTS